MPLSVFKLAHTRYPIGAKYLYIVLGDRNEIALHVALGEEKHYCHDRSVMEVKDLLRMEPTVLSDINQVLSRRF